MGKDDKEVKERKIPVTEFVLSLFDRDQGTFPKGETAVLTAIEKDYGEQYIEPAKQFIERIQSTFEQYAQEEPMIDEEPEGTVMEPTIEQDQDIMGQFAESKDDEKFKPHTMYDPKTGESKKANKEQDHKDLAKKGWTHNKPKDVKAEKKTEAQEIRELGDRLMKLAGL